MRTTLTLDDDVAMKLRELAHRRRVPFKEVVNSTRKGRRDSPRPSWAARPRRRTDPLKLNQLSDELEARRFAEVKRSRSKP